MIISKNSTNQLATFKNLLQKAHEDIQSQAMVDPQYFLQRTAGQFEEDVFYALATAARGTIFDGTICLISGHKFPDIIAGTVYGVEVKTTTQNHWKSTGNSILETTRVNQVKHIFLYFGKLSTPLGFMYRKYEECLYDIAITHSPRYLIDMNLVSGSTIFDKLGVEYDVLRTLSNPVKPFIDYYRSHAKPGEEPWWMEESAVVSPTIKLFSNLAAPMKEAVVTQAMAFFPELFGKSSMKYQGVTGWLVSRHGIVSSSLRDSFTAGGQVSLKVGNKVFEHVPQIFKKLWNNAQGVVEIIESASLEDLSYYWNIESLRPYDNRVKVWSELVLNHGKPIFSQVDVLLHHLLGPTCLLGDQTNDN